MGKEGLSRIKNRFFKLLMKIAPSHRVPRTRFRVGLIMFTMPLLLGGSAPYASRFFPSYGGHYQVYAMAGDILFAGSLFLSGGAFWDKLRALYTHGTCVYFGELLEPRPK